MAGGSELEALSYELREIDPGVVVAPADGEAGRPTDAAAADDEEKGQAGT